MTTRHYIYLWLVLFISVKCKRFPRHLLFLLWFSWRFKIAEVNGNRAEQGSIYFCKHLHDKLLWPIGGVECIYTSQLNGTEITHLYRNTFLDSYFWLYITENANSQCQYIKIGFTKKFTRKKSLAGPFSILQGVCRWFLFFKELLWMLHFLVPKTSFSSFVNDFLNSFIFLSCLSSVPSILLFFEAKVFWTVLGLLKKILWIKLIGGRPFLYK